jgi:hypothetical protein
MSACEEVGLRPRMSPIQQVHLHGCLQEELRDAKPMTKMEEGAADERGLGRCVRGEMERGREPAKA